MPSDWISQSFGGSPSLTSVFVRTTLIHSLIPLGRFREAMRCEAETTKLAEKTKHLFRRVVRLNRGEVSQRRGKFKWKKSRRDRSPRRQGKAFTRLTMFNHERMTIVSGKQEVPERHGTPRVRFEIPSCVGQAAHSTAGGKKGESHGRTPLSCLDCRNSGPHSVPPGYAKRVGGFFVYVTA